jgi:hypothetical protein
MPESDSSGDRLFTVIMDFEGTTSATQFRADFVQDALRLWLNDLSQPGIFGLTDLQRTRLAEGCADFDLDLAPAPLQGLQSIWCSTVSAQGGGIALLNIVETVNEA